MASFAIRILGGGTCREWRESSRQLVSSCGLTMLADCFVMFSLGGVGQYYPESSSGEYRGCVRIWQSGVQLVSG